MAGTMPHAVFVETDLDAEGTVAAYAAELPGCATYATSADDAVSAIPSRVREFVDWLTRHGEPMPSFVGDNWYEVERAAANHAGGPVSRAGFTLDELPPSDAEFSRYLRWLELAREELADALDQTDPTAALPLMESIAAQDEALVVELGGDGGGDGDARDPIDRLYVARDLLMDALETAGGGHDGVRRMLRLAIADDLRAADQLRAFASQGVT